MLHLLSRGLCFTQPLSLLPRKYSSVVEVFDRRTKIEQRERAAQSTSFSQFQYLREEIGWRIFDMVCDLKSDFESVLEVSAGNVVFNFTDDMTNTATVTDSSSNRIRFEKSRAYQVPVKFIQADEECSLGAFESKSFDLVLSNLCLHWVNDLPQVFRSVKEILKPDCAFIGTMFTNDTLFELRVALQLADLERRGGVRPHISPLAGASAIAGLLGDAGFNLITLDSDSLNVNFGSLSSLFNDLRGMGETNCAINRPLSLGRDVLTAAESIYFEKFSKEITEDKNSRLVIPATFNVLYWMAWSPGPNQPSVKPRGSATVSFKDLGKPIK